MRETEPIIRVIDLIDFFELLEGADFGRFLKPEALVRLMAHFRTVSLRAETQEGRVAYAAVTFKPEDDGLVHAAIYQVTAPVDNDALIVHHAFMTSNDEGFRDITGAEGVIFDVDTMQDLTVILGSISQ